jgi:putrescine importer
VDRLVSLQFILLGMMCVLIGIFFVLGIRYIFQIQGWTALFSSTPFYNPATFQFSSVLTATSFAALTYIGFDGVTTLAEDVKNPKRNVLLATVLVCLITGLFSALQIYVAQLVWPDYQHFGNLETAFMDVCRRVGGALLFNGMALVLFIACLGSGLAGQVGAARLMFGMGRDNVLPRRLFGHLDPKRNTPSYNILLIGVLAVAGSLTLSYERAAEVLNFGEFLAFMGVNLAAVRQFYFLRPPGQRKLLADAIVPALGFLFCLGIWWSLPLPSRIVGGAWLAIGIVYLVIMTRGFRKPPVMIDFTGS